LKGKFKEALKLGQLETCFDLAFDLDDMPTWDALRLEVSFHQPSALDHIHGFPVPTSWLAESNSTLPDEIWLGFQAWTSLLTSMEFPPCPPREVSFHPLPSEEGTT